MVALIGYMLWLKATKLIEKLKMFFFLLLAWLMASYMALFSSRMKDSPLKPYGWSIWFVVTVIVLGSLISEWVR